MPNQVVIQPLRQSRLAVASAAGAATFVFDYVPSTLNWEFTLNVPGAPSTALMIAYVNGVITPVGSWPGTSTWGPFTLLSMEQLQVTAIGLTPNAQWTCILIGISLPDGYNAYRYPQPLGALPTGGTSAAPQPTFIQSGSLGASSGNIAPQTIGDIICLFVSDSSQPQTIAPVGGGVTTWTKATGPTANGTIEGVLYWGVVTANGSHSITGLGTGTTSLWAEFGPALGAGWTMTSASHVTSLTGPTLTPGTMVSLAFYGWANGSALSAGSTGGFTYITGGGANAPSILQSGFTTASSLTYVLQNVGDVVCLAIGGGFSLAPAPSGGGVTTWNLGTNQANGIQTRALTYWGVVTNAGSQTLTGLGTGNTAWGEFGPAVGTGWTQDVTGGATSLTGPSLTPTGSVPELAWYSWTNSNPLSAGTTPNFGYLASGGPAEYAAYDLNVTAAVNPTVGGTASNPAASGIILLPGAVAAALAYNLNVTSAVDPTVGGSASTPVGLGMLLVP